jgi:AbrB family looped-hinge helix DNA binding protein
MAVVFMQSFSIATRGRIFLLRFFAMASQHVVLEYLTTTKIGEKGQLTVPKQFREELGLGTGAPFAVLRLGDGLILLPEQKRFDQLCEKISATLTGAGITPKALLATLPETRERVFQRRYGVKDSAAPSSGPKPEASRRK